MLVWSMKTFHTARTAYLVPACECRELQRQLSWRSDCLTV